MGKAAKHNAANHGGYKARERRRAKDTPAQTNNNAQASSMAAAMAGLIFLATKRINRHQKR
jgi:hypothetical protein